MKKSLLLCIFTLSIPAHGMQLLRASLMPFFRQPTINRGSTVANMVSVMQAKKASMPQLSFFNVERKQYYGKQQSYSNSNGNSHQDQSWKFSWGKISASMPMLSSFLWFSKKEDERKVLIKQDIEELTKIDIQDAKDLTECASFLSESEVEHLFDLLSSKIVLEAVLLDRSLRNELTHLLAKHNLGTRKAIAITVQMINLYPEQAGLLIQKMHPEKFSTLNRLGYKFRHNRSKELTLRKGNFNFFIAETLNSLNKEEAVIFAQSLVKGILASTQKEEWREVISRLTTVNYNDTEGTCYLSHKQILAHADILAYLRFNICETISYESRHSWFFYNALKKNETLWLLSPSAHTFNVNRSQNLMLTMLKKYPEDFNKNAIPFFSTAPEELQKKLHEVLAAQNQ